jgi:hypothetical protein
MAVASLSPAAVGSLLPRSQRGACRTGRITALARLPSPPWAAAGIPHEMRNVYLKGLHWVVQSAHWFLAREQKYLCLQKVGTV